MTVNRSKTIFPTHPDLFVHNTSLNSSGTFKILGVMFGSEFTFEWHICSIHHQLLNASTWKIF